MAIKPRIDSVTVNRDKEGKEEGHHAYFQIYDDETGTIIASECIAFDGDIDKFKTRVAERYTAVLKEHSKILDVKAKLQTACSEVEVSVVPR